MIYDRNGDTTFYTDEERAHAQEDAEEEARTETLTAILAESDAVCEGCGADPRSLFDNDGEACLFCGPTDHGLDCETVRPILDTWFLDIVQTPDGNIAEVLCPTCLAGEVFALPGVAR